MGLQLYTVREKLEKDFVGTLEMVARMGFQGVEFAGYGGLSPQEMKTLLERLGLVAVGSHVGLNQLVHHLDDHIEMNLAIGNDRLICPFLEQERYSTAEALAETISLLKQAAERLAAHGMKLGYHNHAFEFTTMHDGVTVEEIILSSLPEDQLFCELDVCWVQYSGHHPIEWINKLEARVPILHYKDLDRTVEGLTVELGKGELPLRAIAESAQAAGTEWLLVEQDVTQRDALVSVEASLQWAKANLQGII